VPTQADLERANSEMHARFLLLSDRISQELWRLERHIEAAPPGVRAQARAAAELIADTQLRLRAETERLPDAALQRFEILRSSIEAQQSALEHLCLVVARHALPAGSQPAPVLPAPAAEAAAPGQALAVHTPRVPSPEDYKRRALADAAALAQYFNAQPVAQPQSGPSHGHLVPVQTRPALPAHTAAPAPRHRPRLPPPVPAKPDRVEKRTRHLGWVAGLLVGVVLGYTLVPRDTSQHDVSARPGERTAPVASAPPRRDVIRSLPGAPAAHAATSPAEPAPAAPAPPTASPAVESAPVLVPRPAPPAVAAPEAIPPAAGPAEERFVPVVFTHRDGNLAVDTYRGLQRRYPRLLAHRRAEAQPADFGSKGIWHRLVVLPAGARSEALDLCDRLQTAGYDRCWVKVYR
jgi:hypothetical protein